MGSDYTSSSSYTIFHAQQVPGGLPVINPACSVVTSYLRSHPTRVTIPTEILRFQSSSVQNINMNGDVRYTLAKMNMPEYHEDVLGLEALSGNAGAIRSIDYSGGHASSHRAVVSADYGVIWKATKTLALEDQFNFSSAQQPGESIIPISATMQTPGAPNQTITYTGPLTPGNAQPLPHGINGTLTPNYFGQSFVINSLTASWDLSARTRLALTYRYSDHKIGQGVSHTGEMQETDPVSGTVEIVENGGIFSAAVRPTANWEVNGSAEIAYADNAFTTMTPRQFQQYRVHTMYRPKTWATITGAFTDRERHNNTNNTPDAVSAGEITYYGPLKHEDYFRIVGVNAVLNPNERYGLDMGYTFTEVYSATNVCFASGAAANLPGTATLTPSGAPAICPGVFARGSTTVLTDFLARSYQDAPTQFGSVALYVMPEENTRLSMGYRVSSVDGGRFFNDARDVNGSMVSTYYSPFFDVAYKMRPTLTWRAEYNYFGYGEGGPSGAPLCSTSVSATATVAPCESFPYPTGLTEPPSGLTAPREFRSNNVALGLHYEF
jgi:hypothetical protein